MDLSTVEMNVKKGLYTSLNIFRSEVKKIWSNSFSYNAKNTEIYSYTQEMSNYFDKLWKEIENVGSNTAGTFHFLKTSPVKRNQATQINSQSTH